MWPSSYRTTKSVKVPPASTPMRIEYFIVHIQNSRLRVACGIIEAGDPPSRCFQTISGQAQGYRARTAGPACSARRNAIDHGPVGLREIDAVEFDRRSRPAAGRRDSHPPPTPPPPPPTPPTPRPAHPHPPPFS